MGKIKDGQSWNLYSVTCSLRGGLALQWFRGHGHWIAMVGMWATGKQREEGWWEDFIDQTFVEGGFIEVCRDFKTTEREAVHIQGVTMAEQPLYTAAFKDVLFSRTHLQAELVVPDTAFITADGPWSVGPASMLLTKAMRVNREAPGSWMRVDITTQHQYE